jgi:hypothetical protein
MSGDIGRAMDNSEHLIGAEFRGRERHCGHFGISVFGHGPFGPVPTPDRAGPHLAAQSGARTRLTVFEAVRAAVDCGWLWLTADNGSNEEGCTFGGSCQGRYISNVQIS